MPYGIYTLLTGSLLVLMTPPFWVYTRISGRYGSHLRERLGFLPHKVIQRLSGSPRIWIHAVSLGEVKVAGSLIEALKELIPGPSFILSTVTEHGRKLAEETFGDDIPVVYAPVDFAGSVRNALSSVRPDIMVFLETEIWPSWIFESRRMGIKTALINGRISPRSIGDYLRLRPFFREVLKNFDAFSMILEEDSVRIKAMGAEPEKIVINGNAKYDLLAGAADPAIETEIRRIYNLGPDERVLVAGSTRQGEEEMILDAYVKALEVSPDTILIIAPRHIDRTPDIGALINARGLKYQLRTEIGEGKSKRKEQIIIINTFGELFKIYSVGTIVFCGASLVPLGGQNPLEPAVWGKVVLYGPSMDDFLDAKDLLESAGASVPVSNPEELSEKIVWLMGHPVESRIYGERAREAVLKNRGAAQKHAQVVKKLIEKE